MLGDCLAGERAVNSPLGALIWRVDLAKSCSPWELSGKSLVSERAADPYLVIWSPIRVPLW
jgi:hypothetical protein